MQRIGAIDRSIRRLALEHAENGQLIEFHWVLFSQLLDKSLTPTMLSELRWAFLAGAETIFAWMDEHPANPHNASLLMAECNRVRDELQLRFGDAEGSA